MFVIPAVHFHACMSYCAPRDMVDPAADARAELADAMVIDCAARATVATTETERLTWWAAAALARAHVKGAADVVA